MRAPLGCLGFHLGLHFFRGVGLPQALGLCSLGCLSVSLRASVL